MKFTIDKKDFSQAISNVENIISSKEIKSIVSSILIECNNDSIKLTSTDLEISIKTTVNATIQKEGAIVVPAKKLSQTIKEFRGTSILFLAEENNITISDSSGISKAVITLMGNSRDEYPPISTVLNNEYISFPMQLLHDMIKKTSYAIADEDARYVFNGLYIKNEGKKLNLVATDGRRLSLISNTLNEELPFTEGVIVPNKTIKELQKLLNSDGTGLVAHNNKDKQIYFKIGNVELSSKLIDGQFPDYNQVIPKSLEHDIVIDKSLFESCIKQVAIMASEPTRQIKLVFNKQTLSISASTPDIGKAEDSINIDYAGDEILVAFNSGFIMDVLKVIDSEDIVISLTSANTPSIIKESNNTNFISVIMPIKV